MSRAVEIARFVTGADRPRESFSVTFYPSGGVEVYGYGDLLFVTADAWRSAVESAIAGQDGEPTSAPCQTCTGTGWVVVDVGSMTVCPAQAGDMDAERCPRCGV